MIWMMAVCAAWSTRVALDGAGPTAVISGSHESDRLPPSERLAEWRFPLPCLPFPGMTILQWP